MTKATATAIVRAIFADLSDRAGVPDLADPDFNEAFDAAVQTVLRGANGPTQDVDAALGAGRAEVEARVGKVMHLVGFVRVGVRGYVNVFDAHDRFIRPFAGLDRFEAAMAEFGPEAHLDSRGGVWR